MLETIRFSWAQGADCTQPPPTYKTPGAAGADLRLNLPCDIRESGIDLAPGQRIIAPTGLVLEIPLGFVAQLCPRSGLALSHGITLANSPGIIDSDYRGEIGVILLNLGEETVHFSHGDRIAQLVILPVLQPKFCQTSSLSGSTRGEGGFGSTGMR